MTQVKNSGAIANAAAGTKRQQQPSIRDYVLSYQGQFAKALPSMIDTERFTRIVMTAVTENPQLQACNMSSLFGAFMQAAQLGLEPNTPLGQAYIIPYGKTATFIVGYRGLMDLSYRSGEVESIEAHTVYAGDEFSFSYGLHPDLIHRPTLTGRGEPVAFYAVYRLKTGGCGFEVMSVEDIRKHAAQFSKARGGPWHTNFEAMAKKTVIKQALKYAPLQAEFVRRAAAADEHAVSLTLPDDGSAALVNINYEITDEDAPAETQAETTAEAVN